MAREQAWLDIDKPAFSEVRFAEQGFLKGDGAGYTLFWEEQVRAPPFWSRPRDQNFHCKKTAELASWSFRPSDIPKTPNPGQVRHCP